MQISKKAEDAFGFAEINVLSFADLYAGKIMAALDRQHPRYFFDIHLLLENEGLTDELRTALIVYLLSHDHPPQTLLSPDCRDITHDFEHGFRGMTENKISLETLLAAHAALVDDVVTNMPDDQKRFLLSFYRREPEWHRLGIEGLDQLPAVRWREVNLDKAGRDTQNAIVCDLKEIFGQESK